MPANSPNFFIKAIKARVTASAIRRVRISKTRRNFLNYCSRKESKLNYRKNSSFTPNNQLRQSSFITRKRGISISNKLPLMTAANIILVLTAAATALMAGLFYAFSCSVNLGLARLSNAEYLSAMQSINRAIQNPIFFAAFFGAPILLPLCMFLHYGQPFPARFWFLLAATVIYLIGTFGVTIFGNVPLNNRLDRFDLQMASEAEIAVQRAGFERRWNNLNTIRTVSSTLAIMLVIISCLSPN